MTPEQTLYAKLRTDYKARHPNYPDHLTLPMRTYKLNTANGLTQAVIAWVKAHGYQAERVNTMGRMVDNTQVVTDAMGFKRRIGSIEWQKGTGTKGSADIHCSIPLKGSNGFAVSVKIEIKVGKDRLSEAQKKYGEQMQLAGGVYLVVHDLNDLFQWWDSNVI